jgi:hypothetical protein
MEIPLLKKVKMWDAINRYMQACEGDTSAHTVSIKRQQLVAEIERLWRDGIQDAFESEGIELHRCRNCGDPQSVHIGNAHACLECECNTFLPP